LKLPVRGTISVFLLAKRAGLLKEITPILLQLEQAGFRIDSTIIIGAKKLAKED
jgi:predicted nucleic acid-binding protein